MSWTLSLALLLLLLQRLMMNAGDDGLSGLNGACASSLVVVCPSCLSAGRPPVLSTCADDVAVINVCRAAFSRD